MIVRRVKTDPLWQVICDYEMPFGERYLDYKYQWNTDYAGRAISEYKRFAYLALISPMEVTPSLDVDEVWHCHILHTREYEQFAAVCGSKLHHFPGMSDERPRWNRQYHYTLNLYRLHFQQEPPLDIWPRKTNDSGQARLRNINFDIAA